MAHTAAPGLHAGSLRPRRHPLAPRPLLPGGQELTYRILIMAKAPILGTVKTRLGLPPQDAAGLQAALIRDAVEKARSLAPTTLAGAPADRLDLRRPLLPDDVALIPRSPGDLGDRMLAGNRALFDVSPDPVLIPGTDAPTLPAGL